jgi:signal transduction histidine kinase/CheY-like chemotaxis protein
LAESASSTTVREPRAEEAGLQTPDSDLGVTRSEMGAANDMFVSIQAVTDMASDMAFSSFDENELQQKYERWHMTRLRRSLKQMWPLFVVFVACICTQAPIKIMVIPCFFAPFSINSIRFIWFSVTLAMILDFGVFGNPLLCSDVGPLAPLVCKIFFHVPAFQAHFYTLLIAYLRYIVEDTCMKKEFILQTLVTTVFLVQFLDSTSKEQFLNTLDVEKRTNSFLGSVSHELRTPLHGAFLYISEIREELCSLGENGRSLQLLKTIETCCGIAKRLTEEVLAFAALKEGQLQLELETFNLRTEVNNALSFARHKLQPKVKLRVEVRECVPVYAVGDKVRFNQIISNLAMNAAKFTTKGEIRITADKLATEAENAGTFIVMVQVKDSGLGLSHKQCEQLRSFEAFNKLSESAAVNTEGTGLGLALSHNLALLMGGHGLTIASEGVGKGSTFSFKVKFGTAVAPQDNSKTRNHSGSSEDMSEAATPTDQAATTRSAKAGSGKCASGCLLADDNFICREGFKIAARQAHFPILSQELEAHNGMQALNLYKEAHTKISFVVLDVNMPVMDGFATARAIREFEQARRLPRKLIIAATADATRDRTVCNEAGIDAVLCKPFTAKQLEAEVAAAKGRSAKKVEKAAAEGDQIDGQ